MYIGRQSARIIECADTNKPHQLTDSAIQGEVVTPDSDHALRASGDYLIRAARRRHFNVYDVSIDDAYAIGFNQGIYGEGRSTLPLAPTTVAAVNDEWP